MKVISPPPEDWHHTYIYTFILFFINYSLRSLGHKMEFHFSSKINVLSLWKYDFLKCLYANREFNRKYSPLHSPCFANACTLVLSKLQFVQERINLLHFMHFGWNSLLDTSWASLVWCHHLLSLPGQTSKLILQESNFLMQLIQSVRSCPG